MTETSMLFYLFLNQVADPGPFAELRSDAEKVFSDPSRGTNGVRRARVLPLAGALWALRQDRLVEITPEEEGDPLNVAPQPTSVRESLRALASSKRLRNVVTREDGYIHYGRWVQPKLARLSVTRSGAGAERAGLEGLVLEMLDTNGGIGTVKGLTKVSNREVGDSFSVVKRYMEDRAGELGLLEDAAGRTGRLKRFLGARRFDEAAVGQLAPEASERLAAWAEFCAAEAQLAAGIVETIDRYSPTLYREIESSGGNGGD